MFLIAILATAVIATIDTTVVPTMYAISINPPPFLKGRRRNRPVFGRFQSYP